MTANEDLTKIKDAITVDHGTKLHSLAVQATAIAADYYVRLATEVCDCGRGEDCEYMKIAQEITRYGMASSRVLFENAGVAHPITGPGAPGSERPN